jgi:hypothetical protein
MADPASADRQIHWPFPGPVTRRVATWDKVYDDVCAPVWRAIKRKFPPPSKTRVEGLILHFGLV